MKTIENKTLGIAAVTLQTVAKPLFVLVPLFILLTGSVNKCAAVILDEEIRNYLVARANFTDSELARLKNLEPVTKLLPAEDKREVKVFGILPIKAAPESVLRAFQDTMIGQNKRSIVSFGTFGSPPQITDLQNLTLEDTDIEDLKKCREGNCNLRLSAKMIERFQKEIDWTAADYRERTTILFRRMILEYVQNYLAKGDQALIEYNDKREPVRLQEEQSSLLKELSWLNEQSPELSEYLRDNSALDPVNIKNSISWSKFEFGLKPVISVTHTITYTSGKNAGMSQTLYLTKQLYANHYFDSSLGLTALINFPQSVSKDYTYLIYLNSSRSASLKGVLGKLTRGTVEQKSLEKLQPLLLNTRYLAEGKLSNRDELNDSTIIRKIVEWLFGRNYFIWLLIFFGLLTIMAVKFGREAFKKR